MISRTHTLRNFRFAGIRNAALALVFLLSVRAQGAADLSLTGGISPDPLSRNAPLVLDVRVTNIGPDAAADVVVSNTPPAGFQFESVASTQGACSNTASGVMCELGAIAANASALVRIRGSVNQTGTANFQALAGSSTAEANPADNTLALDVEVLGVDFVVTNPVATGTGGLVEAIDGANLNPDFSVIGFDLVATNVIEVTNALPQVTAPVLIDGFTQTNGMIELVHTSSVSITGIVLSAANSGIRSLSIYGFVDGIAISDVTNCRIEGCYIGMRPDGTEPGGNTNGVRVIDGAANRIGGSVLWQRNLIGGNREAGVLIIGGSSSNVIAGNFIGLDSTGNLVRSNGTHGIEIRTTSANPAVDNVIGGTVGGSGNLISGNGIDGIHLAADGATRTVIQGNLIGSGRTGVARRPNLRHGIYIATGGNLVGGGASGAGNLISGNDRDGVHLEGPGAVENRVEGNLIGTALNGTSALFNLFDGVEITGGASSNRIGGVTSAAGNLISGNGAEGVDINGSNTMFNVVAGNFIGSTVTGTAGLGNGTAGVLVFRSPGNTIGAAASGGGNLVVRNGRDGIAIIGPQSVGNLVFNNFIGIDTSETVALGNAQNGVFFGSCFTNQLGGIEQFQANRIANNASNGVAVVQGIGFPAVGNRISGNLIYSNGLLGIDLGDDTGLDGVTPNDILDLDQGANLNQNFPVITNFLGNGTYIEGVLSSISNQTYRLEFFTSRLADPSGHGEGQNLLGVVDVQTDATGSNAFQIFFPVHIPTGIVLTATATDPNGNTSEFSPAFDFPGVEDTDGDGLPNWWEKKYFGDETAALPGGHGDADPATNIDELNADTNPTNATSFLRITGFDRTPGGWVIEWPTSQRRFYDVQVESNLTNQVWPDLETDRLGTGGELQATDPDLQPEKHYRVRARLP